MNRVIFLITIVSLSILSNNCKNSNTVQQVSDAKKNESIKAEIEQILKIQEDAYAQHNEDGNKKIQSTCKDGLLYVDDGGIMLSSYDYSHDLANGWIERPHNNIFKFYNNTVIVTSVYKSYNLFEGDTIFLNNRMTKVFVKDDNQWKMAHIGISPLQVNYTKIGYGNTKLFSEYAGVYKVGSAPADTILLINGNLYDAQTGNGRNKMFPLNDSTFIWKDDLGKVIFGKDANGKVNHYTYIFNDGQRIRVSKLI